MRVSAIVFLLAGFASPCLAGADRQARVDEAGVLRWADDGGEVALLGVNYYTPFTIDYAEVKRLGLDHKQVIRDDVAHFRRLGFGCIRVHCFERQFSDAKGNLLDNAHLELLDCLIDECCRYGLYTVLTPIAWWGGGMWTERTRGFSDIYEMRQMTTDRTAWAIQARFLKQFAEHVNRYTGKRYADDPAVLAFECINEPLYPKDTPDSVVTEYINTLTDALRASRTKKSVYYNSWQGRNAAAGASKVDGVTCSSYPTGLVAGHALEGSRLGTVHGSSLRPDASIARKSRMAYEFDAADVAGSYMYPAMAKMFRSEGVQVAAQFQYDPMALADVNRNWQTHHLNLIFTPGKALALAIAAEVFTRVPRGTPYEKAEEELRFPPFRVSAAEDLSELITADRYLTSNSTRTPPPDAAALERVWGCGSSPVVAYGGTGAYFLDRAAAGVWRLQVYPDVFTVADPYTGSTEQKVRVLPGRHVMTLHVPDLGERFSVWPFDGKKTGERLATARGGAFDAGPGDFLLTRKDRAPKEGVLRRAEALAPRFVAPSAQTAAEPLLRAAVSPQWRAGKPFELRADAALATNLIALFTSEAGQVREVPLVPAVLAKSPYRYVGILSGEELTPGLWGVTFRAAGPGGVSEFPRENSYGVEWLPASGTVVPLLRIPEKSPDVVKHGIKTAEVTLVKEGFADYTTNVLRLTVGEFGEGASAAGYTLPFTARSAALSLSRAGLRILARGGAKGARVEIGFRMKNGQGLGCNLQVCAGWSQTVVPVTELVPLWGLPSREAFRWQEVEQVSVLTGAWLLRGEESAGGQSFDLAALEWVPLAPALPLKAVAGAMCWDVFDAKAWLRAVDWTHELRRWQLRDSEGRLAVHLGADRFDGERESLSVRVPCDGKTFARLWQTEGNDALLYVRARAACPKTTAFELALIENGGVSWGTVVPLTPEWQTLRIPIDKLRLFTQWDKGMAALAGPHVRLSRLETINVCFGKWLFPAAAAEPHAVEIAEIGIGGVRPED